MAKLKLPAKKSSTKHRRLAELPSQPDPSAPLELKLLLHATAPVLRRLESDLRARAQASASVSQRLEAEHKRQCDDKRSADEYPQWLSAFVEQVAAAWVLACVFVRTLEDRGLLKQNRLAGPGADDSLREFLSLAPSLSERDYIQLCLRELLHLPAAEALFGTRNSPLWLLAPSAEGARELLELFRTPHANAPALRFGQSDTRFLGDIYQDLNENVRKRYALLQTPDFVEEYILDRTLEPALERFGLAHTNLIDPTCGSGHFLLGAFERLFERQQKAAPNELPAKLAERALAGVFGTDINPYAVAITRFRLTLAFLEKAGLEKLSKAPKLPLNVVVADSLLYTPRVDAVLEARSQAKGDERLFALEDEHAARELLNTRSKFAAIVGNPPYINVKDDALRELYRKAYPSAAGKYSMGVPFTERFFELARSEGRVGMINANSFVKRQFGSRLVTEFLPTVDLDFIVNSAGAYIPGHGTPTVLLFGSQRSPRGKSVRAVLGKRGEPSTPYDPRQGLVWSSIRDHGDRIGYEDDYISVSKIQRHKLGEHPWCLAGGGVVELKESLETRAQRRLGDVVTSIGFMAITGEDDVFVRPRKAWERLGAEDEWIKDVGIGEEVRDWTNTSSFSVAFPYREASLRSPDEYPGIAKLLWPYRRLLLNRPDFGGKKYIDVGRPWYSFHQVPLERLKVPLSITFAEVATHNHFVLDRGRKVFNRTAPIIKLPEGASEDEHLALIAYLNSSTACFWMKQVSFDKGGGGIGGGLASSAWEKFYQFDGTKMLRVPLFALDTATMAIWARHLEQAAGTVARLRSDESHRRGEQYNLCALQAAQARLVFLQEELDWFVYGALELCPASLTVVPSIAAGEGRIPVRGARPYERVYQASNAPRSEVARYFEFTGADQHATLAQGGSPQAIERWRARQAFLESDSRVTGLIEQPEFKRGLRETWRDVPPQQVAGEALLSQVETSFRGSGLRSGRSLVACSNGASNQSAPADWSSEFVNAADTLKDVGAASVPFLACHRYTDAGLQNFRQWQTTWDLQRHEDAGEKVRRIPVPPKYDPKDFRKPEYWRLRGKLDVPKERFISYPGLESDEDGEAIYGWAGWDHAQRARALVELYQARKDDEGWTAQRLTPALAGLQELLPWVKQWHNQPDPKFDGACFGDELAAFLAEELRGHGLTEAQLLAWRPEAKTKHNVPRKPTVASARPKPLKGRTRKAQPENDNATTVAKPRRRKEAAK